jgi:predicted HAD superfamily Cof-like phosphohydrolase
MQHTNHSIGRTCRGQAIENLAFRADLLTLQASVATAAAELTEPEFGQVVEQIRGLARQGSAAIETSDGAERQQIS